MEQEKLDDSILELIKTFIDYFETVDKDEEHEK